jgi:hypothetical protein
VQDLPFAHIDITPTILDFCNVKRNAREMDGMSMRSHITNLAGSIGWPWRILFLQWHRGDVPEKYRAFAAVGGYKLVQANGASPGDNWKPKFELFDLKTDPFEEKDIAADKPDIVAHFKKEYEAWFDDVTKKGFDPPRIIVGSVKENPVRLSRQDWRGPKAGWGAGDEGYWEIRFAKAGKYKLTIHSAAGFGEWGYKFTGDEDVRGEIVQTLREGTKKVISTEKITVGPGNARLEAWVVVDGQRRGAEYVELELLPEKK